SRRSPEILPALALLDDQELDVGCAVRASHHLPDVDVLARRTEAAARRDERRPHDSKRAAAQGKGVGPGLSRIHVVLDPTWSDIDTNEAPKSHMALHRRIPLAIVLM